MQIELVCCCSPHEEHADTDLMESISSGSEAHIVDGPKNSDAVLPSSLANAVGI
jgi:hypothetical protein